MLWRFGRRGPLLSLVCSSSLAAFATCANNRVAIVEKLWSRNGSVTSGLIALNGEAGYQPIVLRGGYHFFMPFQYRVHSQPLVTIPRARSACFARDGAAGAHPDAGEQRVPPISRRAPLPRRWRAKGSARAILREARMRLNGAIHHHLPASISMA